MRARISRVYRFESAHFLPMLPEGHRCRNLHGHNYSVVITFQGSVQPNGFVMDFFEIDKAVAPLVERLDHKLLNDIEGLANPTAEVIAHWFLERLPGSHNVKVYENDDSWAEVTRGEEA
jgi:6-pyruvoyltetrahydropterin/6-carboxytetrahydropterin synthase